MVPHTLLEKAHELLEANDMPSEKNRHHLLEYLQDVARAVRKEWKMSMAEIFTYLLYELYTDYVYCYHWPAVIQQWQKKEFLWNHPNLAEIRHQFEERDAFLENPPEVEEGVLQCQKCGSRKTHSFSKQTRAADESTTVFVRCSQCSHSFRLG